MSLFRKTYYGAHPSMMDGVSNEQLRDRFLVDKLFEPGEVILNYSHGDRVVIGGAMPGAAPLPLPRQTEPPSAAGKTFLERRELGIICISGGGTVTVDGTRYDMVTYDTLFVGMGAEEVLFEGDGSKFYLLSAPAHKSYPTKKLAISEANVLEKGDLANANRRNIHQLIIPGVCDSCQLAMGLTILQEGSVWNTMPPHRHERRAEIYMYFEVKPDARIFHYMGEPDGLRHIICANEQAVVSPPWSVHMAAGTSAYAFIWGMAGENVDYNDMDWIEVKDLR
jgi:4-deoxy-L-threo-5-hexosulose-uronate ketol-isomerase